MVGEKEQDWRELGWLRGVAKVQGLCCAASNPTEPMPWQHPCGAWHPSGHPSVAGNSLHCSIPCTFWASDTACHPSVAHVQPYQPSLTCSCLEPSAAPQSLPDALAVTPSSGRPGQGLIYFAQVWLHIQTLLWTVMATGDLLPSWEPLHTQAGSGRAGSSGRDVLVSGGDMGLSLSLVGWLKEAIMAQILSPCLALPLHVGCCHSPHTSCRCMNCSSFKRRFY